MSTWLTENYLTRGFWGDEAWTAGISRLPINEIIRITGEDFHPPFYYFIVHYIGAPSNYAEVPVRLISTAFFALIPIIAYILCRILFKERRTYKKPQHNYNLMVGILVATSPILLTYAFEARSYALLALESVLSAYIFWRARDEKKGHYLWRTCYFLLGASMIYTHYYAWFILASHAVYLLIFEHRRIPPMLPAALGILAVQLPWLPTLLGQTSSVQGSYWIGPINGQTHWEFLYRIAGGDITTPWQKPLGYILGLTALIHLVYRLIKGTVTPTHRFLLTWILVPAIIPTIISLAFFPVFFYRYLIFSSIPLLILFVYALSELPIKATLATVAVVLLMYLSVDAKIWKQYPRTMRDATRELYNIKTPTNGPVYTVLPAFAEVMYYTAPHDEIIVSPEGLIQFSGKSLLDAYVRLGLTTIQEPPPTGYYFLTPDKQVELR